jgi:hypothetical protein
VYAFPINLGLLVALQRGVFTCVKCASVRDKNNSLESATDFNKKCNKLPYKGVVVARRLTGKEYTQSAFILVVTTIGE